MPTIDCSIYAVLLLSTMGLGAVSATTTPPYPCPGATSWNEAHPEQLQERFAADQRARKDPTAEQVGENGIIVESHSIRVACVPGVQFTTLVPQSTLKEIGAPVLPVIVVGRKVNLNCLALSVTRSITPCGV
jgi:hypothetical protein